MKVDTSLKFLNSNSKLDLETGQWLPAKPEGVTLLDRIRAAWLVLTGKAAAVRWL